MSHLHNRLHFQSTPLMGNTPRNLENSNLAAGDFSQSKPCNHILSEQILYDQVLYAMRGVETEYIQRSKTEEAYRLTPSANADSRHITLVHNLCEAGWFHDKILSY